jgi:dihydropteroate synthase
MSNHIPFHFGSKTFIMGILNVTPDSFSDGGLYANVRAATQRALQMVEEGADIIDIGGESSRPGAKVISAREESERVLPVIKEIREKTDIPLSIDTCKAQVAFAAMEEGADWINDISAATYDSEMPAVMKETGAPVVIMHRRGTSQTMQSKTDYVDIISEVRSFLLDRASSLEAEGVKQIIIDPGLGFAKTAEQNLLVLHKIKAFVETGYPVLVGASRKSFIQKHLGDDSSNILEGSLAVASYAMISGCDILRVHDVLATVRVRKMLQAILS